MKKIVLLKNLITTRKDDKKRIYHTIEGTYGEYYFFAKTDNSFKQNFASDGINKRSVYKLDVWIGGNPIGRDSIKGKGIHVSNDLVAAYDNKWEKKPTTTTDKLTVNSLIQLLEVIADEKK